MCKFCLHYFSPSANIKKTEVFSHLFTLALVIKNAIFLILQKYKV